MTDLKELEPHSLLAFCVNNQIRNELGEILDFEKYRFLLEVYADQSPNIVCMKAAQIGFTTYEILRSAHEAYYGDGDIIYVLPTADDVKRFSGGKTNKIIAQNPRLLSWTKDKDSIEQKQFGKHTIYYQGSWTERAALMITAKKLIVDEYDRCKQDIVEQYDSRLQSVANPKKAYFSNPSIPDFGVHKYYQLSDQKKWHITHRCGNSFPMDEGCIDYDREAYICPHCSADISDEERRMGEWRATSAGKWSGYWIPLWIAPWMPASKICEMKRDKTPEYFANFVAGQPYIGTDNALSQSILDKCLTSKVNERLGSEIIGVDSGHGLYYVRMNKQGVFHHGYAKPIAEVNKPGYDPYNELRKLMKNPNAYMVADQGGDLIGIRKLQADFPGRVFLCWFTKETKNQQIIRWGESTEERGKVLVDRNRAMQMLVDELNDQRVPFNGTTKDWQPVFTHMLNIYRAKEETDPSEPQYGWRWVWKRKGPDHLMLALLYARIGFDRFRENLATIIDSNDMFSGIPTGRTFNEDGSAF